jgi:hypothetical protein
MAKQLYKQVKLFGSGKLWGGLFWTRFALRPALSRLKLSLTP